jgi:hypothetical protein
MERDRFTYINTNRIPPLNFSSCEASFVFCHAVPPLLICGRLFTTLNLQGRKNKTRPEDLVPICYAYPNTRLPRLGTFRQSQMSFRDN